MYNEGKTGNGASCALFGERALRRQTSWREHVKRTAHLERSKSSYGDIMDLLAYLSERSRRVLLPLIFALVAFVGVVDYLTIPPFSFELFYFVPILLASWFAGRSDGFVTAVACAVTKLLADVLPAVYHPNPELVSATLSQSDHALPYWNAGVQLVVFLIVAQFVTALERLRRQQEAERVAALKRTDELKTALLQAVSHDLRTPLASIKTSATTLLDASVSWNPNDRRALLKGIDQECDRLNRLVGNLLDMSRIEGGMLHLERDWYSIDEVVHSALHRLRPSLASHLVELDIPADLSLLKIDFIRVDQVLTNVMENVINYTPAGTPVRIMARLESGNGKGAIKNLVRNVIRVTVSDEGPGVPPQHLARLFDRFYQVSGTGQPHSTGLGLSIAQGMVQAHGGQIEAQSSPGHGLTVSFTLPLDPDIPGTLAAPDARALGMLNGQGIATETEGLESETPGGFGSRYSAENSKLASISPTQAAGASGNVQSGKS